MENLCQPLTYIFSSTLGSNLKLNLFIPLRRLKVAILHWAIPLANSAKYSPRKIDYLLVEFVITHIRLHYLDISTQPNEPEKLLTSNIHLLSPQKWSQFVHLNRENIFSRGQPEICPGFLVISKIESTYS